MISFEAIGTWWEIDAQDSPELRKDILERIEIFSKNYSRFRDDSWVVEISKKKGNYIVPDDGEKMLDLYKDLYELTDGLFTPLIGHAMEESGYDAKYSLQSRTINETPKWEEAIDYKFPKLELKTKVLLDVGAMGKGYLVDLVGEVIKKHNVDEFTVDAGGDILHNSPKNIRIGLEHPEDTKKVIGVVEIANSSICGSGTNRRKWKEFNHILNPKTKTSVSEILSVWVVAKETILADALATALFFSDPEALNKYDYEYLILRKDFTVKKSNNFPGKLYYK